MESSMMNLFWFSFIIVSAIMFLTYESAVLNLICLFSYTLSMSVLYYMKMMNFWMLGLVMIVVLTGLFLIFTYMTSVTPESPTEKSTSLIIVFLCVFLVLFLVFWLLKSSPGIQHMSLSMISGPNEIFKVVNKHSSSLLISLVLVSLLLLLVILFMRFTYNKGGGLRKKF
uniref:NADH dehydrogenase subunit 6 n=1 Tax=Franciscoloa roseicapillae TaxID=2965268 RepID=A0A9Y1YS33_9NEOP|nr:NADH dehydrogenase subunit 6 [Franciscoloa roseicapillae]WIM51578.1 NADH dehydrogenase subunit 6 [Franciscoloa roseicapillae]